MYKLTRDFLKEILYKDGKAMVSAQRQALKGEQLVGMRGKASEVHVDLKLEYLKQVEKLEVNRDALKKKYEQLSKASESSWNDMKEGTENAWNQLKGSVAKTLGNFK